MHKLEYRGTIIIETWEPGTGTPVYTAKLSPNLNFASISLDVVKAFINDRLTEMEEGDGALFMKNNRGFTLLEVMIAHVIFGILLWALLSMFNILFQAQVRLIKLGKQAGPTLRWDAPNAALPSGYVPVYCVSEGGNSAACSPSKPCTFAGIWTNANKTCELGILSRKG